MKTYFTWIVTLFSLVISHAQDITGDWNGLLKVQGMQLRIVFHVTATDGGYQSTMDSPDQGVNAIPVTATEYVAPVIKFAIAQAGILYEGQVNGDEIKGALNQGGQAYPLDLSREEVQKQEIKRPQTPVEPLPYTSEQVTFRNEKAGITLAGTLTLPGQDSKYPAVVLITGSGPQDRDESLMGHKPFLVLSDYLTRHGIAVLRFDDRGVSKSEGDFATATSADFATDVAGAVAYLKTRKEIDAKKIGLAGHSEGGIIAPMVAADEKDIAFIVLLAGTGIRGDQLLLLQQKLIAQASGVIDEEVVDAQSVNKRIFEIILETENTDAMKEMISKELTKVIQDAAPEEKPAGMTDQEWVELELKQIMSPWMQYFIKYDPAPTLARVKCPVLAVNGAKDLQVPPAENLTAIAAALKSGGNKKATTIEYPGLNHLFQECTTGLPSEYGEIEQTMSPVMMDGVTQWILRQVK